MYSEPYNYTSLYIPGTFLDVLKRKNIPKSLCISAVCMVYLSEKHFVFQEKTKSFPWENKKFFPNRTCKNKMFFDFQDTKNTFVSPAMYSDV